MYMYIQLDMRVHVYVHMYTHPVYACTSIHICTCTHPVYAYSSIHHAFTCTCTCMYMYVHVHIWYITYIVFTVSLLHKVIVSKSTISIKNYIHVHFGMIHFFLLFVMII